MRILFASIAEKTHFLGMVPLAWAMQTAGHDIRVATQPDMIGTVTGAGLTAVPVGRDHRLYLLNKIKGAGMDVPFYDMTGDGEESRAEMVAGYDQLVRWWWRVVNDPMIDDLTALCRQWRPDLVIWEPITYAAPLAATAAGAPHARFMWGMDVFAQMRRRFLSTAAAGGGDDADPLGEWLGGRAAANGGTFTEEMVTGVVTIDYTPASLRLGVDAPYLPIRYIPYNGPSVIPPWLSEPPTRPRVCLTLGTAASERLGGYFVPVPELIAALAELDIELVATVSDALRRELGDVPPNVRLESFVPLHALVPTCSVVIHHGGGGSFCTSLINGVPQLVLPNLFDAPIRGANLAARGAGLMIPHTEATGERVRDGVRELLSDPRFRLAAAALAAETRAMPTPRDVVPALIELAGRRAGDAALV